MAGKSSTSTTSHVDDWVSVSEGFMRFAAMGGFRTYEEPTTFTPRSTYANMCYYVLARDRAAIAVLLELHNTSPK